MISELEVRIGRNLGWRPVRLPPFGSELAAKRTQASIMPRRRSQFPQPEMIVAKRANKCWSAGRNRPKTSPECRGRTKGLIGRLFDVSSNGRYGGAKMDYLGALCMFVRAVEAGSFSKAAIATNTKTSTVSRALASLEEDLGVSMFP